MDIKWWLDLDNDTSRLKAVGFGIIITLASVVSYQYIERNSIEERHREEVSAKDKRIELLISQKAEADAICAREKLIVVEKLYEEQKLLNQKQLAANQKQAEENGRQRDINMQSRQATESAKTTIQQIKAVITD